ncbi:Gfo/Idh/MocA family protein [Singulisphaera sp. PoT]|uniref:Gfo/Idh/MocA family protein n=1 Tax=Singulisphaera sp. PoT TaxID=3411797 RepID=UPI003BF5FDAB
MNAESKLRWGILGCARITRRGLIPGIRASHRGTLHALASRNADTVAAWTKEFGVEKGYSNYDEVLSDPAVDAVYIPLPNELHREWVFKAADAGKHILCEKPLALNAAEAQQMVDHCKAKGVVLMEAFMWRHQVRTTSLRRLVADGAIGELQVIRSTFCFTMEGDDWRLDPKRGGGALWDVGCYGLSTARLFAGCEPTTCHAVARFGPTGVDMSLSAVLKFPNGVLAEFDCSFEQRLLHRYSLIGTKGTIAVPDAYLPPARPMAYLRAKDAVRDLIFDGHNQYAKMVDAFAQAVDNKALPVPAEDGLAQMKVLDAIIASARSS